MLLQGCQKAAQTLNAWGQGTRVQGRVRCPQAAGTGSSHAKGKSELYAVQKSEELGYFPLNILRVDFFHCFLWDSKNHQLIQPSPRVFDMPPECCQMWPILRPSVLPGTGILVPTQKPFLCPVPGPQPSQEILINVGS